MAKTPDKTELLLGLGLIILFGLCPPIAVLIVFIMIFAAK